MRIIEQSELTAGQKARIVELWNAEYPLTLAHRKDSEFDEYLNGLSRKRHFLLFGESDELIGWAITFDRDGGRWFAIIIDGRTKGKGYGTRLIDKLKETESRLFGWVIDHSNSLKLNGDRYISPLGFYKKIGFSVCPGERIENHKMSGVKIEWNALI
ncbi:MAG: GNAT family N-acetyltransferase [Pyrinomonadaceae bacterium]